MRETQRDQRKRQRERDREKERKRQRERDSGEKEEKRPGGGTHASGAREAREAAKNKIGDTEQASQVTVSAKLGVNHGPHEGRCSPYLFTSKESIKETKKENKV